MEETADIKLTNQENDDSNDANTTKILQLERDWADVSTEDEYMEEDDDYGYLNPRQN